MKTKVTNFLSQGLLAFLPALMIAIIARTNMFIAAEMSFSFAIVGVFISIAYLGMRSYISINGHLTGERGKDITFRIVNVLAATILVVVVAVLMGRDSWLIYFALLLKLSESFIDLKNGIDVHNYGVERASINLLTSSTIRAVILISCFLAVTKYGDGNHYALLLTASILAFYFFGNLKGKHRVLILSFKEMKASYKALTFFSLATIICSMLSAMPRLIVSAESVENQIVLIALSISPVLGVVFQSIWLSEIHRLKKLDLHSFLIFTFELLLIVFFIYISDFLWRPIISIVYGIEDVLLLDVFSNVILAVSFFYAGMTLMNIYKYEHPWAEGLMYFLAITSFTIAFYVFDTSVAGCMLIGGVVMMLSFFVYLLKSFLLNRN